MSRLPSLLMLLAVLLVGGCGFQLRGAVDLPPEMDRTYVTGLPERDVLYLELKRQLRAAGVAVVDSRAAGTAELRILEKRDTRRVLSVGSNATVREYELSTIVTFDVRGLGNEFEQRPVTLQTTRDLTFDETNVLGKAGEEALLREDMERELAWRVLSRLQQR